MIRLVLPCILILQVLASAQSYVEASGQTVAFNLKAGEKAAWDKAASPIQKPQVKKAKTRTFSVISSIDQNQITCTISGPLPVAGAAVSLYRLDGLLVDRKPLSSSNAVAFKKHVPNGYYWLRLELNSKSLALTRMLVAR